LFVAKDNPVFQLHGWGHKMATKFEKSKKDVEKKAYGKEGSKKDMAADKRQAKPMPMKKK